MNKRMILVMLVATLCAMQAQAQETIKFEKKFDFRTQFNQSFGLGFQAYGAGGLQFLRGLNYTPRLNLKNLGENKLVSVDVAIPITISGQLLGSQGGSFMAFDVPLVTEISVGHYANQFTDAPIGVFAGIGVNYQKITVFTQSNLYPRSINPLLTGGVRASFLGRSVTLRYHHSLRNRILGGYRGTVSVGYNI
jgi:hypothetical protein